MADPTPTPPAPKAITDQFASATNKNVFDDRFTADSVIVTLSIALAYYNCIELTLLIFFTFKKFKGLYCWSLIICNVGVMLYTMGMMLSYFDLCVMWLWKVINDIGWVAMVTFQSLVLYSRLGLIVDNEKILAGVKWMIIIGSTLVCTTVVALDMGNAYSNMPTFWAGYFYIEHIQLVYLTIQELLISGLYVWKTSVMLKDTLQKNTRSMVRQLFAINVIIISMDIVIVVFQYLHLQLYQEAAKAFVYSVKLKLEIHILSRLVDLFHSNKSSRAMTLDMVDSNVIPGKAADDIRREILRTQHDPAWLGPEKENNTPDDSNKTDDSISAPKDNDFPRDFKDVDDNDDDVIRSSPAESRV